MEFEGQIQNTGACSKERAVQVNQPLTGIQIDLGCSPVQYVVRLSEIQINIADIEIFAASQIILSSTLASFDPRLNLYILTPASRELDLHVIKSNICYSDT